MQSSYIEIKQHTKLFCYHRGHAVRLSFTTDDRVILKWPDM